MTDQPINLTQLREHAEARRAGTNGDVWAVVNPADLLALIDAVEAALRLQANALATTTGFDRPDPEYAENFNRLWDTLARFTT